MRMEDYVFTDREGRPVILTGEKDQEFSVSGKVYGRKGFPDGSQVTSSLIVSKDGDSVITRSGSIYELGKMNKDYELMLQALKDKIPVLRNWFLEKEYRLMDLIPPLDAPLEEVLNVPTHEGYVLTGEDILTGEMMSGEVVEQEGNTCVLHVVGINEDYTVIEEKRKVFVSWEDFDFGVEIEIRLTGKLAGLPYDGFERSFLKKCRPVFPLSKSS